MLAQAITVLALAGSALAQTSGGITLNTPVSDPCHRIVFAIDR